MKTPFLARNCPRSGKILSVQICCILIVELNLCQILNFRPEFTDTLALKDSVHPIIGKIDSVQAVSNDVFASSASSFNIITGAY